MPLLVELQRCLLAALRHGGDVAAGLEAAERYPAGSEAYVDVLGKDFLAVQVEDGDLYRSGK